MSNSFSMIQSISMEISHEVETSAKYFAAIPDSCFSYKPHEKSMTMGKLASHCLEPLSWLQSIINDSVFKFDPQNYKPNEAKNQKELIELSNEELNKAMELLKTAKDEILIQNWKMIVGEQVVFEMPKAMVLRFFVISHMIHHRGQLSVYMRLNNLPIPKAYGPTADDSSM